MTIPMQTALSQLSFERVEQYASRRFHEAMRIYRAEFLSGDTSLPIKRIGELLKEGSYQLIIAQDEQHVLGFALIWICQKPVFVHLDYFATVDEWKGKGIGTRLYRWLTEHLSDFSPRARLLTLEVEDDLIAFYRRSDTRLLQDVPYLFPGLRGPVPMHLMVYDTLSRATLDRATVCRVVRGLYCGLHGRDVRDPWLQSCLKTIPAQISLT
jgi:ribosomal protein S18 acetylase RimI-like enzyme